MKRLTHMLIGVLVLTVAILGAGAVAAADLYGASGFHRNAVLVTGRHFNLRSASQGRISETDSYQATAAPVVVLARYAGRYYPEPGQPKRGQCVTLKQAKSYLVLHLSRLVTICPSGNGTRVVVYRDLYVGP